MIPRVTVATRMAASGGETMERFKAVAWSILTAVLITGPARAMEAHRPPGLVVGNPKPHRMIIGGPKRNCVPPALQRWVSEQSAINRRALGLRTPSTESLPDSDGGVAGVPVPLFPFFPMAGRHMADIFNGQFVDLDPSPASLDYACRPWASDGHAGIDTGIRSFGEQMIGVPVLAARDGVVVFAQDGFPDTNIFGGFGGNIVAIEHADGVETQYYHLKNGSVAVSVGQPVTAGQQIGLVGSSGNSFGPHLHFNTLVNGQIVEPFSGACNPVPSQWADQASLDTDELFLWDFGITRTDLFALPEPWWHPWPLPGDGQFSVNDPFIAFWWFVYNFPEDCLIHVRFLRPDGSVAVDAQWNWGNTEVWRAHKNWFAWDFPPMGPVTGTWRLVFELDGRLMIDAPIEVVTRVDPDFNRPPEPIGAAFDPVAPGPGDVIFCSVSNESVIDDLDWDIVRYRYVWTINGQLVRDVATAAMSDALPANAAAAGDRVACTVTPSDGTADGESASASVTIGGVIPGDLNGDGIVNGADLGILLLAWGPCPPRAQCPADLNGDDAVDGADLGALLLAWTG
jgi:hypothetical protein